MDFASACAVDNLTHGLESRRTHVIDEPDYLVREINPENADVPSVSGNRNRRQRNPQDKIQHRVPCEHLHQPTTGSGLVMEVSLVQRQ